MTLRPDTIAEVAAIVQAHARLRIRGAGTKPALSAAPPDVATLDLTGLSGIVEYTPEECTFTALAGTPVAAIAAALQAHGQALPFDPPLVDAGATIGGTMAAGVNGSCRYRFGGIRDFVLGVRVVDGRGTITRSGGKVVKNAAGFLLHQALVGSCGRLGALVEVTCKVFPAAEAHATIRLDAGDLASAAAVVASLQRARFDLEAIDLEAPSIVATRIGGFADALPARVAALQRLLGDRAEVLTGAADAAAWQHAREFAWVPAGRALVRVPTTLPTVPRLDALLARHDAVRRYAVAGNVAFIAWREPIELLQTRLAGIGLTGQVLFGAGGDPFIGAVEANAFGDRLKAVLDPDGRF